MINKKNIKKFHIINQALDAYKKFLHTAKIMEDKIGMALAANRISICYFNLKNY